MCIISSVPTFILLLFTEHALDLHDFAHHLSYFTSRAVTYLRREGKLKGMESVS